MPTDELKLHIPADYAWYEKITDHNVLARLDEWKGNTNHTLLEMRALLESTHILTLAEQADIVSTAALFDGQDPWIAPDSRDTAEAILSHFDTPQQALLLQILSEHIKPHFQSNPHPSLNSAGRKLSRPAGGPMASQDFYDSQTWKNFPWIVNVLTWCVRHIPKNSQCNEHLKRETYESHWHLIIPPIMILLDDFEARYKLQGVNIVMEMLQHVPSQLLKRTGVDGLIRSSLNTCLTHLNNPETAQLITASVAALLSLTQLTTSVGSADQFDQLCALLGEGIISGIWFYAYDKPDVILTSLHTLPPVLRALKIGNARYFKALVTQFVHALKPETENQASPEMQTISLQLLTIIIEECAVNIPRWKGTILDGIARCWVSLKDSKNDKPEFKHVRVELRHTCEVLGRCCPSVMEAEYKRLLETDAAMFRDLLDMPGVI